ncbi:MAG: hypothetical protein ACJ8EY_10475 [Sphingomicrobium sp.]
MKWGALIAIALVISPAPASAGAGNFTVVNATGLDMQSLEIRRFGDQTWKPLSSKPVAGARGPVEFNDPDCAFDIRARLAGGAVVIWPGVNLCEAKSITLNRSATGALWVDYD